MQDLITLAVQMADEAGEIVRQYFRTGFDVENKSDESPVTIADRSVELRLRELVEQHRPDDGILGEEFGPKESKNGLTWVFDPIDGTKSFVIGRPTFGTLIGLWDGDTPLLGIIDQPITNERWLGVKDQPTTLNGKGIRIRPCNTLKSARIASTSPSMMPDLWPRFYEDCGIVVWGGDCYSYGLIASGGLDIVIEKGLGTYDYAAIPPIIEGAGGIMIDWHGKPLTLNSGNHVIAVGDPALKDPMLNMVADYAAKFLQN